MPTIKEVADLAGVAVGTVSHVITGSVPVSEALKRKVLAAISELDYHPNHVARSLKTSRTRTLGMIVPDLTISFFPQIIRGAEAAARVRDYTLIAANSDESSVRQKELLTLLRSQRVEGILLVIAAEQTAIGQISRMLDASIPLVCVDRLPDHVSVDSVSLEDQSAAELGVSHLIRNGHRRIAIVTGPLSLRNERQRLLGYQRQISSIQDASIEDCGREPTISPDYLIWEGNLRPDDVAAMARERLADSSRWPDAIFCTNGPTALGVLRAMHSLGIRTPQDIGFLTFDELTVDDLFSPQITTIVQPAYDIGFRSAEMLLRRIEAGGRTDEPLNVRLPGILKIRDSSRLPARLAQAATS
jgi:DNA-binding LacI/PurR family transcriptional regulator